MKRLAFAILFLASPVFADWTIKADPTEESIIQQSIADMYHYPQTLDDGTPNPESLHDFVQRMIEEWLSVVSEKARTKVLVEQAAIQAKTETKDALKFGKEKK